MNTRIATVASALVLLAGTAFAQSTTSSPPAAAPSATPPAATAAPVPPARPLTPAAGPTAQNIAPAINPLTREDVSKLNGTNVYGTDDKKIGDVTTELMNPGTKTIDRLVVNVGGVLGVGGHHVAIPVNEFSWDSERGGFKLSKTSDDLKSMAEWKAASIR